MIRNGKSTKVKYQLSTGARGANRYSNKTIVLLNKRQAPIHFNVSQLFTYYYYQAR